MTSSRLGVGIVGCGAVTQAVHLPVLAELEARFRVVHCVDNNVDVAVAVAARAGATPSSDVGALLDDPAVDVVAVCSPEAVHADHVVAACQSAKRAVLCEKPLADTVEAAQRIADASAATGVPVVVGTMHAYEPAWLAARARFAATCRVAPVVRVTALLPPNPDLVAAATELARPPLVGSPVRGSPEDTFRDMMLRLAIHDLPLVRSLLGDVEAVGAAHLFPRGYHVALHARGGVGHLTAVFLDLPWIDWRIEAIHPSARMTVRFPHSYVAGPGASASVVTTGGQGALEERFVGSTNGYLQEWLHVERVARREVLPLTGAKEALADVTLAHRIADEAAYVWGQAG